MTEERNGRPDRGLDAGLRARLAAAPLGRGRIRADDPLIAAALAPLLPGAAIVATLLVACTAQAWNLRTKRQETSA